MSNTASLRHAKATKSTCCSYQEVATARRTTINTTEDIILDIHAWHFLPPLSLPTEHTEIPNCSSLVIFRTPGFARVVMHSFAASARCGRIIFVVHSRAIFYLPLYHDSSLEHSSQATPALFGSDKNEATRNTAENVSHINGEATISKTRYRHSPPIFVSYQENLAVQLLYIQGTCLGRLSLPSRCKACCFTVFWTSLAMSEGWVEVGKQYRVFGIRYSHRNTTNHRIIVGRIAP